MNAWVIFDEEEVARCLNKVLSFRYLGLESLLSPAKGAVAMQKRALLVAKRYKGACWRVAKDGPDVVEVIMATWNNIATPSILYGCDFVPFSETAMMEVNRCTMQVMKEALGLPIGAPGVGVKALLGTKTFTELLVSAQLKFYFRLMTQETARWIE